MNQIPKIAIAAALVAAAAIIAPEAAWACNSCWGANVDTPTTRGITMAMTALIGMTSLVWGGIGAFFLHVRRRARLLEPGKLMVNEYGDIHDAESDSADDDLDRY